MNAVEQLFAELQHRLGEPKGENIEFRPNDSDREYRENISEYSEEVIFTSEDDWVEPLYSREKVRLSDDPVPFGYGELSDEQRELMHGAVRHIGFHVLAFYKSIRFRNESPYRGQWGIFYREPGIAYIAEQLKGAFPTINDPTGLAIEFLRQHERLHYMFDVYSMKMETAIGKHLYSPMKHAFRKFRSHQVEEALANRRVWSWSKKASVGIEDFAYAFMKLQPNAYARFDEPELCLKSELAANLIDHHLSIFAARDDQAPWVAEIPAYLSRKSLCPEYVIQPASISRFISPAVVIPPVRKISEEKQVEKVLTKKYQNLKKGWGATKDLLLREPSLLSLNFKPWLKAGRYIWSVRVKSSSNNFRAHLRHIGNGEWIVIEFGPHKTMGHG